MFRSCRPARVFLVTAWIGALLAAAPLLAARADEEPLSPVQRFQQTLIEAMRDGERLGFEGRRARMQALVDEAFHVPRIARAIIGRHHEALSAAEREALAERIRAYAVATLASRFARHDGERFEAPRLRAREGGRARASSRFLSASGGATALDYALLDDGGGWRILNVWFDGVSGTDIQRAEFEAFLRDGGAERLKAKLDELIAALATE